MKYIMVGKIIGTHGIKGEVKVLSDSDFTEERFRSGTLVI
jgi:16S rRNA processing protein RimM